MRNFYKTLLLIVLLVNAAQGYGQDFTDSNLPIVIINTDVDPATNQPYDIPDDPRVLATMKVIQHPDGSRNYISDQNTAAFLNYNGRINIEIRGSSSQNLPKKGYGLTTLQADDSSNNNIALLGMPTENDWVLNGLAFDPSLIRDCLSYSLARQIGNYASRTAYCELVVNGDYRGLYLLQEKIKIDGDRVNIAKMTVSDNDSPNVSGGYIVKADKTTGGDPVAWTMSSYNDTSSFIHDSPKPETVTQQQHNYIHNQFTNLAVAAYNNNESLVSGYPALIDVPSFVDFMLLSELSSNADTYQLSTYFHKDRNGKLRAGPIWDYNLTYGNDLFDFGYDRSHYDVWQLDNGDNTGAKFWKDLFDNATFRCYLSRRFNQLIAPGEPLKHNNLVVSIDIIAEQIAEAAVREQQRWGTAPSWAQQISAIKVWLYQRLNWMSANLGSYAACNNVSTPSLVIDKINYNPGTGILFPVSNDQEFIEITNTGTSGVNLTGVYLSELGLSYQFPASATIAAAQSIFLASNSTVFETRYGIAAFGQYSRNLSNSSQKLTLSDAFGNIIDSVEYFDSAPWPNADGNGSYLQLISTDLDNNLASSWIASSTTLGRKLNDGTFSFSAYPNPVSHILHLQTDALVKNIKIYEVSGKLLYDQKFDSTAVDIDFSAYSQGLYYLTVYTDVGVQTQRIIK